MVIILNQHIREDEKEHIRRMLSGHGYILREIVGSEETVLGAVGPARLDIREVEVLPGVARVIPISQPFKLASRELQARDSIVRVGEVPVGSGRVVVIAGPGVVESREQIMETAAQVREAGAVILRGGAYKPSSSPYAFHGLGEQGLAWLREAGERYGMPLVSEIVSPDQLEQMKYYVNLLEIGARNMQNFELLKAVGSSSLPVMLKRGPAARIEEWLMSAEYLMAHGNESVILCEPGIRSFETYTTNSLDLSSIPVVKKLSHLPVIVDPSQATGIREKVMPMAMAAVAAGADGLSVAVHPDPESARSDGAQSLFPPMFERLVRDVQALCPVLHKELYQLPYGFPGADGGAADLIRGEAGKTSTGNLPVGIEQDRDTRVSVAFQGEAGAYSEMALQRYFASDGRTAEGLPCPQFKTVFDRVLSAEAEFGILPIENALTGSIHENYDLLIEYPDLHICGETRIRIQHSLIGLPDADLDDIRIVFSHPQGLAQCSRFLDRHPQIERRPYYDTAGSVAHIAREGNKGLGAIANSLAAGVYGMKTIKEGIETNPVNYTRFVIIRRGPSVPELSRDSGPADKASMVFSTQDKPGALLKCMEHLSRRELNLRKIESRPIHGKPWEYMFYLDVDIRGKVPDFFEAVTALEEFAMDIRVLGLYASG